MRFKQIGLVRYRTLLRGPPPLSLTSGIYRVKDMVFYTSHWFRTTLYTAQIKKAKALFVSAHFNRQLSNIFPCLGRTPVAMPIQSPLQTMRPKYVVSVPLLKLTSTIVSHEPSTTEPPASRESP